MTDARLFMARWSTASPRSGTASIARTVHLRAASPRRLEAAGDGVAHQRGHLADRTGGQLCVDMAAREPHAALLSTAVTLATATAATAVSLAATAATAAATAATAATAAAATCSGREL